MVCQRVECSTRASRTGWVKDNGSGEPSQRTYTVRGQAPERASQVSTIVFWEVHEDGDDDDMDRCDEEDDEEVKLGGDNSRKSRDHSFGLAMAVERHLEQILETRRGMRMVWCSSITLPTHSKNISERSSTGSLPEGLVDSDEVEVEGDKRSRGDRSASGSDRERAFNLSMSMSISVSPFA